MEPKPFLAIMLAVLILAPSGLAAVCPAGYDYYVNKTLTERSGVALPNHAVEFTMDTAALISGGKMNASACGVYIKGVDGTALPSWIVDGTCNKAATRIFTKIPRLTASGNYKINICYGNLTPTISTNEIKSIFAAADNFNGGTGVNTTYWFAGGSDGNSVFSNIVNGSYMNFTCLNTGTYNCQVYRSLGFYSNVIKNYYAEMKFKPVALTLTGAVIGGTGGTNTSGGIYGLELNLASAIGAFSVNPINYTMTQAVNSSDQNSSGLGIGSVWQKAIFRGNYSRVDGNATTEVRNAATDSLVSFNRGSATHYGFNEQPQGGLAMQRVRFPPGIGGSSNQRRPVALWDYAFLRNATMSPNGEPNVSYSSTETLDEVPASGLISIVMNTASGTRSSLRADFNYTPATTRTASTIYVCNLTKDGAAVKSSYNISNATAQNITYAFPAGDDEACFTMRVACRTNGTNYAANQSSGISYCISLPIAASVTPASPINNAFVPESPVNFSYLPETDKGTVSVCTIDINASPYHFANTTPVYANATHYEGLNFSEGNYEYNYSVTCTIFGGNVTSASEIFRLRTGEPMVSEFSPLLWFVIAGVLTLVVGIIGFSMLSGGVKSEDLFVAGTTMITLFIILNAIFRVIS
jgi:hypothetical protein